LDDGTGQRQVIASIDSIAATHDAVDPVAEFVRQRHGPPSRKLLLAATHNHYAPEFRIDKQ